MGTEGSLYTETDVLQSFLLLVYSGVFFFHDEVNEVHDQKGLNQLFQPECNDSETNTEVVIQKFGASVPCSGTVTEKLE